MKSSFKVGVKQSTVSNKIVTVKFEGKPNQPVFLHTPYGIFTNIPEGTVIGLLADQCNEESMHGIPTDINNREDLEDGELAIGIPSLKNRIYFKADNSIVVQNENGTMTLKEDGQLDVNGNFTVDP